MTAPRPRELLSDWLFVVLRRATRWAATGIKTSQPRKPASRSTGCANPIVLSKFIFSFALIAIMPLFLLPMLLVRIVKFGPSALRFSATTDVVSGDTARWGAMRDSDGIDQLAPVRMW